MTNTAKTWTAIVAAIALIIIGWFIWRGNGANPSATNTSTSDTLSSQTSQTPATSTNASSGGIVNNGLTTSSSDSSNAALQTDLNTIDTQMTGLANDSATADQSVNTSATVAQ